VEVMKVELGSPFGEIITLPTLHSYDPEASEIAVTSSAPPE
jgi:hypothetical protein